MDVRVIFTSTMSSVQGSMNIRELEVDILCRHYMMIMLMTEAKKFYPLLVK